jgi:hypothetical protein
LQKLTGAACLMPMPAKPRDPETEPAETPHYHGHRERLRERFLDGGPDAVTEYELLELILFRAIPRRDVKPLAKALIATFGSFAEVVSAPRPRLRRLPREVGSDTVSHQETSSALAPGQPHGAGAVHRHAHHARGVPVVAQLGCRDPA